MMNQLTATIGEALVQQLPGFKLNRARSSLTRSTGGGWQAIAIEALPTASRGFAKLAAHAQIRIDALEDIYLPLHPFVTAKDAKIHATLTINCDELLTDNSLANGFASDDLSVKKFAYSYACAINRDVIPWLEKYSDEDAIYLGLSDSDPNKWITSNRLARFPVLLSILARRNDWAAFEMVSQEFCAWCDQPYAAVYKPLADSLRQLQPAR